MDNAHKHFWPDLIHSGYKFVTPPQSPGLIEEELELLKENAFSHSLFCMSDTPVVLDVGPDTDVFPIFFASYAKSLQVMIVEKYPGQFDERKVIHKAIFPNIQYFQSIEEALSAIRRLEDGKPACIDLVKIGRAAFSLDILTQIADEFRVGHLCGEFGEYQVSKIDLYRLSTRVADSFCWREGLVQSRMSGYGNRAIEVSIVVPINNVEKYLPQCIESLVSQTIRSKEILLVNDGSTDSSGAIAEEWAGKYPEIRVIHQQNGGCAAARSRGLSEAVGKFVGFVDSDDWVEAEMYEKLYEAAVTNNADIAQCGYQKVFEDDNVIEPVFESFRFKAPHHGFRVLADIKDAMYTIPSIWRRIYDTAFLRSKGIDFVHSLPRFDDLPFQFEVLMHANKMVAIPEVYYNYRLGRVGQDVSARDERLFIHFNIFEHLRKKIETYPKIEWERLLKRIEFATHEWALSLIEDHLKSEYATKAYTQILQKRLMISRTMILLDAFKLSKARALMVVRALWKMFFLSFFSKREP